MFRIVSSFGKDKRGSSAIEFAIVSLPFIMTIVFVLLVGLVEYQAEALDFAASKAARQVMTGQVQGRNVGQAAFRTQLLCPYLPVSMSCNNVIISLQTVTPGAQPGGYYPFVNSGATALNLPQLVVDSAPYQPGAQSSYEYLLVVYPVTYVPSFFAKILGGNATYNGAPAFLLVSTVAFKNEPYS